MSCSSSMRLLCVLVVVVASALVGGCYRVRVRSGLPPADPPPEYDFRWRHGYLFGLLTEDTDLELSRVCSSGWAELQEQGDLLTGVATVATLGLYAPRRVTVVCAVATVSPEPPLYGYDTQRVTDVAYPAREEGAPPPPPPPLHPEPASPHRD